MATVQSPPASRAGLITSLVIFIILFVTALVFAIYYNVELKKSQDTFDNYRKKYADIVSDADLSGGEVDRLKTAAKENPSYQGLKAINVAIAQRDSLARLISPQDHSQSSTAVQGALTSAANTLKDVKPAVVQPTDTLVAAISNLSNAIATREGEITKLKQEVTSQTKRATDAIARAQTQVEAAGKETEEVNLKAASTLTQAQDDRNKKQGQIDDIEKSHKAERDASAEEKTKLTQTISDRDRRITELEAQIKQGVIRRAQSRPGIVDPIVRAVDANIIRIAGNGIVYVNLGTGDQISPGLTFQVYDKGEGVPPMGDGVSPENMPIGKGALEVIRVGSTSSECRVLKVQPGATFSEGDLLVNLVYDKNTKYRFLVHGNFDVDQDGRASSADAEIIKRLITQWGGQITDQINIDTDFVVLGKEPEVPLFTQEQLIDPNNLKIKQDAEAALDAYTKIRDQAGALHIPVMNQNRFLYYVGYFEQGQR